MFCTLSRCDCPVVTAFLLIILPKNSSMEEYVFDFFGEIGKYSYGANYLKYYLNQAGDKPVRMRLSSYGGEVHEALLCADAIRKNGNVTIEIVGKCASSATFMAFAAKSIEIHDDAFFLVHNSAQWVEVYGRLTKEEIQEKIQELENAKKSSEATDMVITQKYVDRSGKSVEKVTALMKENRWMTASEALEWGFVDLVIENKCKKKPTTNQIQTMMAMGLPEFPNDNVEKTASTDEDSFLFKICNHISEMMKSVRSKSTDVENSTNKNTVMRTEENTLCQILNVSGFEENQGTVSLTVEQLKLIENNLNQSQTDIQTITGERDRYSSVLDSLDSEIKKADTPEKKIDAFNAFVARIPVNGVVLKHKYGEGETDYSGVAVDPINFEEEV